MSAPTAPVRHTVLRAAEARYAPPTVGPQGQGFTVWTCVEETTPGAVHTGFEICRLEPGGTVEACTASHEKQVYLLEGEVVLQTPGDAALLRPGDYALIPTGVPHAWRNESGQPVRWAHMAAPLPRAAFDGDVLSVPEVPPTTPIPVDPRDPRTRRCGHIDPANLDPARQTQENLALSASMRTALLVYSGINLRMMIDTDLGADMGTMFMVSYDPDGVAGPHDHPLEETYLFLSGSVEATFDGAVYHLGPGDFAFAGVGCVHSFRNLNDGPLRWLETQAPQPPSRHAYRFRRDWNYLGDKLASGNKAESATVSGEGEGS
jgi:quercetin dioxygenase-like cupin family protein